MADKSHRPRPPPSRRRDKPQLSCDPCRHRKLKCDRQQPCGTCSRRGITASCTFVTTPSATPNAGRTFSARQSTNLHARISELESLVVTLLKGQSLPAPPEVQALTLNSPLSADVLQNTQRQQASQDGVVSPADPGTLNLHDTGTSYAQSVHWEAILTKVRGLKEDVVADSKPPHGSHLFYGPNRHVTRKEVMAAMPPRPVVDRLMALHFDSYFVTPYLIHSKKFLREYESFWEDPSATSIAWIGLLFSMLFIAVQLQTFATEVTEPLKAEYLAMKDAFCEKAMQCLILARYTTGGPHILETLITILTGEFVLLKDGATDGWLLISMILHLAVRMGYHRDPDHFPGISPFEGEIRRRIWLVIMQLDLTLSLERGLPRNATDTHIDTKEPRNLRDEDFDEDTSELPPLRPETEWTPVLPLITRGRLISALSLICEINTDIHPPSHERVVKADALLEDVHKHAIPPILRWGGLPHPITDSPTLVIQRISVETTYYKARILLYRRALLNPQLPQDSESIKICLTSALKILSFQQTLHEESQPLGRLSNLRWKIAHIFHQDVLLATSVLCLYLQDVEKFQPHLDDGHAVVIPTADEIRDRLTTSYDIWLQMSKTTMSKEATKVAKALSIVLGIPASEAAVENGSAPSSSYDLLTDFDMNDFQFSPTFDNNQYFPSGWYSPITFFDNVLGNSAGT